MSLPEDIQAFSQMRGRWRGRRSADGESPPGWTKNGHGALPGIGLSLLMEMVLSTRASLPNVVIDTKARASRLPASPGLSAPEGSVGSDREPLQRWPMVPSCRRGMARPRDPAVSTVSPRAAPGATLRDGTKSIARQPLECRRPSRQAPSRNNGQGDLSAPGRDDEAAKPWCAEGCRQVQQLWTQRRNNDFPG